MTFYFLVRIKSQRQFKYQPSIKKYIFNRKENDFFNQRINNKLKNAINVFWVILSKITIMNIQIIRQNLMIEESNKNNSEQEIRINELIERTYNEKLKQIYIDKFNLDQENDLQLLLMNKDWTDLKSLKLFLFNNDVNIKILLRKQWPMLTYLNLNSNKITYKGIKELTKKEWPSLEDLLLNFNDIKDDGLKITLQKFLNQLQLLSISDNNITANRTKLFSQYDASKLKVLICDQNRKIGNFGIKALAKAEFLALEGLYLSDCNFGDQGIIHLIKPYWPQIKKIDIGRNFIHLNGYGNIPLHNWGELFFFGFFGLNGWLEQGQKINHVIGLLEILLKINPNAKINRQLHQQNGPYLYLDNIQFRKSINSIFESKLKINK